MNQQEIDQQVFDLYDEYCHGDINRREFLSRAAALTIAGVSALAMAQACPVLEIGGTIEVAEMMEM